MPIQILTIKSLSFRTKLVITHLPAALYFPMTSEFLGNKTSRHFYCLFFRSSTSNNQLCTILHWLLTHSCCSQYPGPVSIFSFRYFADFPAASFFNSAACSAVRGSTCFNSEIVFTSSMPRTQKKKYIKQKTIPTLRLKMYRSWGGGGGGFFVHYVIN